MIRNYEYKKIYRNFKVAYILSVIASVLSCIVLLFTLLQRHWGQKPNFELPAWPEWNHLSDFCIFIGWFVPFSFLIFTLQESKKNDVKQLAENIKKESVKYNDVNNIKREIIFSFEAVFLESFCFLFNCIGCIFDDKYTIWNMLFFFASWLGFATGQNLIIFIADIFLGLNCKLIKEEWAKNPPQFLIEEQKERINREREAEQEERERIEAKNTSTYEKLVQKCGARFFIKYYNQIESLPLRDVQVTEDYPFAEKEERLKAAREIIDLNLQTLALEKIIERYDGVLEESEIEKAKLLLKKFN